MIGKQKELCYKCLTEANDIYHLAHENRRHHKKIENVGETDEYSLISVIYDEQDLELEQRASNLLDMLEDLYNER